MIVTPPQRIISHGFGIIPRHPHSSCLCPLLNSFKVAALVNNLGDFSGHTVWRPCKGERRYINDTLKTNGSNVSSVYLKSAMGGLLKP